MKQLKRGFFLFSSYNTRKNENLLKSRKETTNMDISKENVTYCDVLKIELARSDINTGFKPTDCLYMRPVAAFLLAIIKSPDIQIQNTIGKIFKEHNLLDYTYLNNELDIDHFYKSFAYTSLYKASGLENNMIKAEDVTITLVSKHTPKQLFDNLTQLGITNEKTGDGIYQIKDGMFSNTQVIVWDEMEEPEQKWLKSLINYAQEDFFPRLMLLGFDTCSKMIF